MYKYCYLLSYLLTLYLLKPCITKEKVTEAHALSTKNVFLVRL